MAGIRLSKLSKQFGVRREALAYFLSSKGFVVSTSPNFKVPESAVPLLLKEFGNGVNTEALAKAPVKTLTAETSPLDIIPEKTKTGPAEPLVQPDNPYLNGVTGKYKLLVKNVTELYSNFEYSLVDAQEKQYKAISEQLYSEGNILRCIVTFKVEHAKLVVESVAVCKKQDLAIPIPVTPKGSPDLERLISELPQAINSKPLSKTLSKPLSNKTKSKSKTKTKSKNASAHQSEAKAKSKPLGHPERTMASGEYNLKVYDRVRGAMFTGASFRYLLEDADGFSYFALSNYFFEIGSVLACKVEVKETIDSKKVLREVSIQSKVKSGPKRKKKVVHGGGGKRNNGYTQYDFGGTPYTGGCHIIYTRM